MSSDGKITLYHFSEVFFLVSGVVRSQIVETTVNAKRCQHTLDIVLLLIPGMARNAMAWSSYPAGPGISAPCKHRHIFFWLNVFFNGRIIYKWGMLMQSPLLRFDCERAIPSTSRIKTAIVGVVSNIYIYIHTCIYIYIYNIYIYIRKGLVNTIPNQDGIPTLLVVNMGKSCFSTKNWGIPCDKFKSRRIIVRSTETCK